MKKDTKIYVAGHTGLVGGATVRKLQAIGYSNLVLRTRQELDLLDHDKVKKFFQKEKPEYVVLAAAKVGGIKANMTFPADFLYENLVIQNNIIWSAFESGVKKLLFLGSSCVYPAQAPQPIKEEYLLTGPLEPTNEGYAVAKIAGMKLCEKIYEQHKRTFVSCMPCNIYGPGDNINPETSHVIPALVRRMHEAKEKGLNEVVIWGSGQARREFLFVDDLADALVWLLVNFEEKQFINVGAGTDVTIRELAELIKDVVGFKGDLRFDSTKPDGMKQKLLDVSKLTARGWKATTDIKSGLGEFYTWFKTKVS